MTIEELLSAQWAAPRVPENIPCGDMPGDKTRIDPEHIQKAATIFPLLAAKLIPVINESPYQRAVVTVCGGSGVGKTEISSLLTFYLNTLGIGSYTMSGDNYPLRIPRENDAERLRIFRMEGLKGLIGGGQYGAERMDVIRMLWEKELDADTALSQRYPWLALYQQSGRAALAEYLGSKWEIDFDAMTSLISQFKCGADELLMRRMGRSENELWYDRLDVHNTRVLIVDWTHGNSSLYRGVDIPILLCSTPAETLAHRRQRNRDGKTDSPFTMMVLEIEQKLLDSQADRARIILSRQGKLLSYRDHIRLVTEEKEGK